MPIAATAAPARGTVLKSNVLTSYTRQAIATLLANDQSPDQAKCDVRVAEFTYATIGVDGEPTTASAALLVPGGSQCPGPFPLVSYSQGTESQRRAEQAKEIRDAKGDDTMVTHLATQGYVVVSSDYLGIGQSTYAFHPYLHAASEASSTIDAMRAARQVLQRLNTPLSGKVMLTGFSQGGHAAMATQREIEAHLSNEFNLVASAPISGPYALSQTFRDSWSGRNAVGEDTFGIVLASYAIVGATNLSSMTDRRPLPGVDKIRQPVPARPGAQRPLRRHRAEERHRHQWQASSPATASGPPPHRAGASPSRCGEDRLCWRPFK
ncbi:lipase family protein [Pantoea ananatis]|uniref:alpha/beta hydrolase family protein n=1 Tax=Pantoea ananas TaxID=553 RepID=UPI00221FE577|nr:lipase family protein [Pantoea ananatis]